MKITRDSYEPFFLDYLEGNLEESMIDAFLDFLEENPDLKDELSLFKQVKLFGEPAEYTGKEHLYKSVADEKAAFEIKSVALMEGDLKGEERQMFEQTLASDYELKKEYGLMAETRLVANTDIKYSHKKKLYKKSGTLIWLNWPRVLVGAAALVLIFWGIQSLFQPGSQTGEFTSSPEIALVKPLAEPVEKKVESTNKILEPEADDELTSKEEINPRTSQPPTIVKAPAIASGTAKAVERDLSVLEKINPLAAQLKPDPIENQLAEWNPVDVEKTEDSRNIMSLDEFVATRAKKAGGEGLLSANRIIRLGLNVASELSGDRIGYKEKDGKISRLDFETRLMAFSIPLQKE